MGSGTETRYRNPVLQGHGSGSFTEQVLIVPPVSVVGQYQYSVKFKRRGLSNK